MNIHHRARHIDNGLPIGEREKVEMKEGANPMQKKAFNISKKIIIDDKMIQKMSRRIRGIRWAASGNFFVCFFFLRRIHFHCRTSRNSCFVLFSRICTKHLRGFNDRKNTEIIIYRRSHIVCALARRKIYPILFFIFIGMHWCGCVSFSLDFSFFSSFFSFFLPFIFG